MRVKDIFEEAGEIIGTCSEKVVFKSITRGIELLCSKDLFDPQIGYLDFTLTEGNTFALPRDVKSPIRINVNCNPSFARGKLFEFAMNTDGTVEGDEIGWSFADRGTIPINDERPLPGKLSYVCDSVDDVGKTIVVWGKDMDGRDISTTLAAELNNITAVASTQDFTEVTAVRRLVTARDCYLLCDARPIARYYPDEEVPRYRVLKLARNNVTVRMIYRKEGMNVSSQEDLLPVNSHLGMIQAVRAYRYYQLEQYELGAAAEAQAVKFCQEDQASRNDHVTVSPALEVQTAINNELRSTDGLIVADVYDDGSEIFGPIGRQKLFDRITDAVEALSRKSNWDSASGVVDIWRPDNSQPYYQGKSSGYFVLPRFVEGVQAITLGGCTAVPRNKWFQFHINGPGESDFSSCCGWDDLGETVLLNRLPLDADRKYPLGVKLAAIPILLEDEDAEIRIFGTERLATGELVPIRREGVLGYLVQCKQSLTVTSDSPVVVEVERITKKVTTGFVKLVIANGGPTVWTEGLLLGFYYPDELEPRYRAIQIGTSSETRIRVRFRRRTVRYSSLYEPIPLRSRLAVVAMLRSVKLQATDLDAALQQQALGVQYLSDEAVASSPTEVFDMQVSGNLPTVRRNIA